MNKHILMVIDHQLNPGKYTKAQLKDNSDAAYYASFDAHSSDATVATYSSDTTAATYAAAYAADDINTEYWIDKYFEHPGENKDDYIKELNK